MTFSILRHLSRYSARETIQHRSVSTAIPGLKHLPNFLDESQSKVLQDKAVGLYLKILQNLEHAPTVEGQTYLSKQHNLNTKKYFRLVNAEDDTKRTLKAQHFINYGAEGHGLTYFIGNNNIPEFIKTELITRVLEIPEVRLLDNDKSANWNFTFNTYTTTSTNGSTLAGFDFHKDVASNGEITMIYSIGCIETQPVFEIRHPSQPSMIQTVPLTHNSLLLLDKVARWDCEHRVSPVFGSNNSPLDDRMKTIYRMSLVLGVSRSRID